MRPLSHVRFRVTLVATAMAAVIATLGSAVFVSQLHENLEDALEASARTEIGVVGAQLKSGTDPSRAVLTSKNDVIVQVAGTDGIVIATDHPRLQQPLRDTPGVSSNVRAPGLTDHFLVAARTVKGGYLVIVGRSQEQVARATDESRNLLFVSVPIGLVLIAIAVWIAVGRGLRPVEAMRSEAAAITSTALDRRLAVPPGRDEIPRLARTLNAMLDRIDAGSRRQRQFVSDASHELRSPLAAIRQTAEVARDYPGRVSTGDLARDVLTEERRMEEMVTALLVLARMDDAAPARSAPVDLDDVVLTEVRRFQDVKIDASGVGAGQVLGDPVLLGQVVRNLLSNAVRHARARVAVSLHENDDDVVLTVDDDGSGVPEEEASRIFDRFVRLDESRARDAGGSGLGLAIVAKVVEAGHGTVRVERSPAGGARFVVVLPAAHA